MLHSPASCEHRTGRIDRKQFWKNGECLGLEAGQRSEDVLQPFLWMRSSRSWAKRVPTSPGGHGTRRNSRDEPTKIKKAESSSEDANRCGGHGVLCINLDGSTVTRRCCNYVSVSLKLSRQQQQRRCVDGHDNATPTSIVLIRRPDRRCSWPRAVSLRPVFGRQHLDERKSEE